ncbi:phospholipase D-like domain-containing protein [Pseudomonas germanica]
MKNPAIFVKVPFGCGTHKFKMVKARRWGAIDQLILQALAETPCTPQVLSDLSGLPRQLIIEILIPLMQVGWVEISNTDEGYLFQATLRGLAVATFEDLPVDNEFSLRVRSFLVDPITQECYRLERKKKKQSFQIYNYTRMQNLLEEYKGYVAEVRPTATFSPDLTDIFDCVANDDEEVNGFAEEVVKKDYSDSIKYALAIVDSDDLISGIPDISPKLRDAIIIAANMQRDKIKLLGNASGLESLKHSSYQAALVNKSLPARRVPNDDVSLILGAEEHQVHLHNLIDTAHSKLIIHSTFINSECLDDLIPRLLDAARRSVQIDILWGQTEPEDEDQKKFIAFKQIADKLSQVQTNINNEGLGTLFRLHRTQTQSHAKFIISDIDDTSWQVTLGSCNWLSTRFNRFEASICVEHPLVVSDALSIASHLALGGQGLSNQLSRELAVQATILSKYNRNISTSSTSETLVQLISAPEHHLLVKTSSDEAVNEIFICSHRISYAGERPVLTPLKAALKENSQLSIKIAYGRASGNMKNSEANTLNKELTQLKFKIVKSDDPQIHAKILSWDSDNLVISSMNWLSASSIGDIYNEVGIFIQAPDITNRVREIFLEKFT